MQMQDGRRLAHLHELLAVLRRLALRLVHRPLSSQSYAGALHRTVRGATRILKEKDDRKYVEDDTDAGGMGKGGERPSMTVLSWGFSCSSSGMRLIVGSARKDRSALRT